MLANFMRSRKNHHLVPNCDVIANADGSAKIEKACDIEPAALPNRKLAIEISSTGNVRRTPYYATGTNLKSS
jgi:hypothetical protein